MYSSLLLPPIPHSFSPLFSKRYILFNSSVLSCKKVPLYFEQIPELTITYEISSALNTPINQTRLITSPIFSIHDPS